MQKTISVLLITTSFSYLTGCGGSSDNINLSPDLETLKINLGEALYNDANLSEPAGQSCASCHDADAGFADPDVDSEHPVSEGVVSGRFGNRNAPTASYAAFIPEFHYDSGEAQHVGGQFVDGRASNLIEQAKGPFLNPVEMANTDETMVVEKVRNASYAEVFKQVYGANSLEEVTSAYHNIADAIAAFEQTDTFSPFSSKFDAVQAGSAAFTATEMRGFDLFTGAGLCTECHVIQEGSQPQFTNFTYSNIGTPKNIDNPIYNVDATFVDTGLAANPNIETSTSAERGKFRVPTLRNVEITAPYMHNGALQTLEQVVSFYNTRDADACDSPSAIPFIDCWPEPEVANNMELSNVGDLLLNAQEEADIVAFLKTLTDGYAP